jgi:23S rRNA pseudouridine1911/1915/1917 synthase
VTERVLTVDSAPGRIRLDVFVAAELGAEFSRAQAARMIKAGLVRLNGAPARAADAVRRGDRIEIDSPVVIAPAPSPADIMRAPAIDVIYADDEIVVVNKPAGMTVHPAPGHPGGTLVDALLARFPEMAAMGEADGVMRPGIVHRLDKETSGVMVVARTPFARMELARQFKARTVGKIYLAVVRGAIARERFSIAHPVGRHPVERKRMSVNSPHGREALSEICVLARLPDVGGSATLVGVRPLTGRTHQIRVHLASIGHPCLGDLLYGVRRQRESRLGESHLKESADAASGRPAREFERQALHATALRIAHPRTAKALEFAAPLPRDFFAFLAARGVTADAAALARWVEIVESASRSIVESASRSGAARIDAARQRKAR